MKSTKKKTTDIVLKGYCAEKIKQCTVGWYFWANDARNVKKALEKEGFCVFLDTSDEYPKYPYKVITAIDSTHTKKQAGGIIRTARRIYYGLEI